MDTILILNLPHVSNITQEVCCFVGSNTSLAVKNNLIFLTWLFKSKLIFEILFWHAPRYEKFALSFMHENFLHTWSLFQSLAYQRNILCWWNESLQQLIRLSDVNKMNILYKQRMSNPYHPSPLDIEHSPFSYPWWWFEHSHSQQYCFQ